ncbi:MAG: glycine--tRNA ligase subunit beta [Deltaproteobacteria bacterium]|nr:glycine--tRNA ligase subunit beta [Deltaproteobacteria bacterium]
MTRGDFILELGVEEIPASYFGPATTHIRERLHDALAAEGLTFDRVMVWGGPRRLAVGLWGLLMLQPDVEEEITGPPLSAAFDSNGNPTKAAQGFAKGQGVPVSDLYTQNTPKGPYLAVKKSKKGRATQEILSELIPQILESLPFPKVMRWGDGTYQFVRPVHWLLAALRGEILPMTFAGIRSGKVSYGHRFLHPGPVVITGPDEYPERLSEAHVLVDFEARREQVKKEIARVTEQANSDLKATVDEELVDEVANLLEEPFAVLGHYDSQFLDLPLAVASTAMKEHQRYFPITDSLGRQAPYFVAVNNTKAKDMDVVKKGHERVLRARLEDARFYWLEDRKTKLSDRSEALKGVVFHHLMGTSHEKVQRFKALALALAAQNSPEDTQTVSRAADLCKNDLVSGMVGEFPSLQGVMGREYALADGEAPQVAEAIKEHYLPNRSGGALPQSAPGAILSVADKLDTIVGCFSVGLLPTGAADPFGLRRQALGIMLIMIDRSWNWSLEPYVDKAIANLGAIVKRPIKEVKGETLEFFKARLKSHILGLGVSSDGAEAVLGLYGDNPLASVGRAVALEAVKKREGFRDLAQTFKRVVNIIKKFGPREENPVKAELLSQEAEKNLMAAVADAERESQDYLERRDYAGLLDRIVTLRQPVDLFFEKILVDDPDPDLKNARVALLKRTSRLFELVADFSRISTTQ